MDSESYSANLCRIVFVFAVLWLLFALIMLILRVITDTVSRVKVRFRGGDGRPLRPGTTELIRLDRWDWADGTWWLHPGKL